MRKRFFFGLLLVAALIWGPAWVWSAFDLEGTEWSGWMRLPIFIGIGLGGYLLWEIVVRSLVGHDDD